MAQFLARHFIEEALKEINKTREEILEETKLNSVPHFIPLNIALLQKSLKNKLLESYSIEMFLRDLEVHYLNKVSNKTIISSGGKLYHGSIEVNITNIHQYTPAKVLENGNLVGLLFSAKDSSVSAQSNLFSSFLNTYVYKHLKGTRNLGNNSSNNTESNQPLGRTPSSVSVDNALNSINKAANVFYSSENLTPSQIGAFENLFNAASNAVEAFKIRSTYTQIVKQTLTKEFSDSLLSIKANVTIIDNEPGSSSRYDKEQSRYKNAIIRALEKVPLEELHFSRNMLEETDNRLYNIFSGNKKASKTTKIVKSSNRTSINVNTKATSSKLKTTLKAPASKIKNLTTKRLISLSTLLNLLNNHIQDVVSANMQNPYEYDRGSRKLLTYRTGRFASSVKIERLTQSRAGMITAFYSYMKNPYATFSAGGIQQNPKSRDPKLLISKSVREIAAKYVAEQMRAVNV